MCGIAGIITKSKNDNKIGNKLQCMNNTIVHRGPDGEGIYVSKSVGFSHRRLSILDLSKNGKQPMSNYAENICITYNGEIYNHIEIRDNLKTKGYSFKSNSDTETILYGYQEYGSDLFTMLNGIFALAIHDKRIKKVFLCRDRMGVKPLYYRVDSDIIYFGSEQKAILAICGTVHMNYDGLKQFLYYGYVQKDKTLFAEIHKVLPGHIVEINTENLNLSTYPFWTHEKLLNTHSLQTEDEIIKLTRTLLENAVKRQLQSDVPVGIFLSGGIDSSAITAFASKHYPNRLNTYTASFDFNNGQNELKLAKKIAKKFNTNHHEFHIEGADLPKTIETLVHHHDEPFSDAANIPLFLMSNVVKSENKVILQGDGGDELFGGYPRYHLLSKFQYYQCILKISDVFPTSLLPSSTKEKINRYRDIFRQVDEYKIFANLLTLERKRNRPQNIFHHRIQSKIDQKNPFLFYKELSTRFNMLSGLDQKMMWIDTLIILPDLFLEKVDKSTMANSIEVRVPFLDNDLVTHALSLPSKIKLKKGVKKYLLKKALTNIVPDEVLFGKKKGFGVPFGNWLKGPLKSHFRDLVFSDNLRKREFFNLKEIEKLFTEHISGKADYSQRLWKIYNLSIWLKNYSVQL